MVTELVVDTRKAGTGWGGADWERSHEVFPSPGDPGARRSRMPGWCSATARAGRRAAAAHCKAARCAPPGRPVRQRWSRAQIALQILLEVLDRAPVHAPTPL